MTAGIGFIALMSVDLIRYDLLVQDALRAVVRRVLTDVVRDGLPGDHHLYISFDTRAPGVRVSTRLKEKYPEEMTIVLQHQFWDLLVTEPFFEVGLSFNGIPERLHVPFDALKGFFDPSVKFGLQFEPTAEEAASEPEAPAGGEVTSLADARPTELRPTSVPSTRPAAVKDTAKEPAPETSRAPAPPPPRPQPRSAPVGAREPAPAKPEPSRPAMAKSDAAKSDAAAKAKAEPKPAEPPKADATSGETKEGGAQVVRLDAFRKK